MTSLPPLVRQAVDERGLGECELLFRRRVAVFGTILAVLLFVFAGDATRAGWPGGAAIVAIMWPLVILGYGAHVWWQRSCRFYVFAEGFVDVRGGRVTAARWGEVERLWHEHSLLVVSPLFPWWSDRFRIHLRGQRRPLRLDGTVRGMSQLFAILRQRTEPAG